MRRARMERNAQEKLEEHIAMLKQCSACPNMVPPVVTHRPSVSKVYLVGQAPGPREGVLGRPFAWTAGKRMFQWFEQTGIDEDTFRERAYMSAVCRCFPGKTKQGGDRVPTDEEIRNCSNWMKAEFEILHPELVIPVGRLAIEQFLGSQPLAEVIGMQFERTIFDHHVDLIPLPHPSGTSTWFQREPGRTLLQKALTLLSRHPHWIALKRST
ncbi:MAG TPA: uracil-DNA glycosylase family protein [Candidatus Obscuribacterales bacterium]